MTQPFRLGVSGSDGGGIALADRGYQMGLRRHLLPLVTSGFASSHGARPSRDREFGGLRRHLLHRPPTAASSGPPCPGNRGHTTSGPWVRALPPQCVTPTCPHVTAALPDRHPVTTCLTTVPAVGESWLGRDAGVVAGRACGPRTRFLVPSGGRTRSGSDQRRVRWGGSQAYGVWPSGKGCGGRVLTTLSYIGSSQPG